MNSHYVAIDFGSQATFPPSVTPSGGNGIANHYWIYGR